MSSSSVVKWTLLVGFFLILSLQKSTTQENESSVYLSLRRTTYTTNNSDILITKITQRRSRGSLACRTTLENCCKNTGNWFFPNGSQVLSKGNGSDMYLSRERQIVALNRRNRVMGPTGLYCCVVQDSSRENQTFCANIVLKIPKSPTLSSYALTLSGTLSTTLHTHPDTILPTPLTSSSLTLHTTLTSSSPITHTSRTSSTPITDTSRTSSSPITHTSLTSSSPITHTPTLLTFSSPTTHTLPLYTHLIISSSPSDSIIPSRTLSTASSENFSSRSRNVTNGTASNEAMRTGLLTGSAILLILIGLTILSLTLSYFMIRHKRKKTRMSMPEGQSNSTNLYDTIRPTTTEAEQDNVLDYTEFEESVRYSYVDREFIYLRRPSLKPNECNSLNVSTEYEGSVRYDYADREFMFLRRLPLDDQVDARCNLQNEGCLTEFVDDGIYF